MTAVPRGDAAVFRGARPGQALVAALLVLLTASCGRPTTTRRAVLIVIDTTHAAHLGCYGGPSDLTPHIDALAARGMRFDRAFSNTTWTLTSTVSLLTGQLPESHGIVTKRQRVPDDAELAAELFARDGWRTAAFVQMVYASDKYGLEQGFGNATYYQDETGPKVERRIVRDVLGWLDAEPEERAFAYVHLRRPHSPYRPSPEARRLVDGDCELRQGQRDDELAHADWKYVDGTALTAAERAHVEHLYRGNLATVDDSLAPLLARLEELPDTTVVLTSDHGEGLGQHGHFGHGGHLQAEHIDIPLIVTGPGIPPGVDFGPACTVDVLPTLAELCDLPNPRSRWDGQSLVERLRHPGRAPEERTITLSARFNAGRIPQVGVVRGNLKLLLDASDRAHLYDRLTDREDRDLLGTAEHEPLIVAARRHRDVLMALDLEATPAAHPLDPEQLAELERLGYIDEGR